MKLDTLLLMKIRVNRVDVIKVDVEGAEEEVLEGVREVIKRFKPVLIVEICHDTMTTVVDFLKTLNYEVNFIDKHNILATYRHIGSSS